jgi:hypothetical protein
MLAAPIQFTPISGRRAYRFEREASFGGGLTGEAIRSGSSDSFFALSKFRLVDGPFIMNSPSNSRRTVDTPF